MGGLKDLGLSRNKIGDEGAMKLSEKLPHLKSLEKLDLSTNNIGDKGAAKLAEALPHVPNLQGLSFTDNRITAAGEAALAAKKPPRLKIDLFLQIDPVTRENVYLGRLSATW